MKTAKKMPTYKRQQLVLYFLEAIAAPLDKFDFFKLLMLYIEETQSKHYAFVLYKYGCYSFLCADDLDLLEKRGWVERQDRHFLLNESSLQKYRWAQKSEERRSVKKWLYRNPVRGDSLIAETYRRYPYYAVNSTIKNKLLNPNELKAVRASVPEIPNNFSLVFTLGYEGIHFEEYINKLIKNRVTVLCDVRKNPFSRKFGFSGTFLKNKLPDFGIAYLHFPELGIDTEKRQGLKTQADYQDLFSDYRLQLPNRKKGLERLKKVTESNRRIALTCFEAEPHRCHRHCISDFLAREHPYTVQHL